MSWPRTLRRHSGSLWILFALWGAFFVMMASWAVATPVAGGPDESGHIMKAAATVRGDLVGTPTDDAGIRSFVLPANVADLQGARTCFAGQPNQTPACAPSLSDAGSAATIVRSGVAGYNPLYYALVGWPSLFLSGTPMVLAMRLLSALLVSGLWAVTTALLGRRGATATFFLAVAATPITVYLGGVLNPSGVEIAATAAVFALCWTLVRGGGHARALFALLVGAVVLLLCSRAISPLFALLAVAAVVILEGWRPTWRAVGNRRGLVGALCILPFAVFAVWWILAVSGPAGYIPAAGGDRPGALEAFWTTLDMTGSYLLEIIGVLGWFDAWLPPFVYGIWLLLLAGSVVLLFLRAERRAVSAAALIGCGGLVVPALLHASVAHEFGYIWQGRYSLPFVALFLVIAAVSVRDVGAPIRIAALSCVTLLLHVWAFVQVFKRYAVGAGANWSLMGTDAAWSPVGGVSAIVTFVLAVAVLGIGVVAQLLPRVDRRLVDQLAR